MTDQDGVGHGDVGIERRRGIEHVQAAAAACIAGDGGMTHSEIAVGDVHAATVLPGQIVGDDVVLQFGVVGVNEIEPSAIVGSRVGVEFVALQLQILAGDYVDTAAVPLRPVGVDAVIVQVDNAAIVQVDPTAGRVVREAGAVVVDHVVIQCEKGDRIQVEAAALAGVVVAPGAIVVDIIVPQGDIAAGGHHDPATVGYIPLTLRAVVIDAVVLQGDVVGIFDEDATAENLARCTPDGVTVDVVAGQCDAVTGVYQVDATAHTYVVVSHGVAVNAIVTQSDGGTVGVDPPTGIPRRRIPAQAGGVAVGYTQALDDDGDVSTDEEDPLVTLGVQRSGIGLGIGRLGEGRGVTAPDGDTLGDVHHLGDDTVGRHIGVADRWRAGDDIGVEAGRYLDDISGVGLIYRVLDSPTRIYAAIVRVGARRAHIAGGGGRRGRDRGRPFQSEQQQAQRQDRTQNEQENQVSGLHLSFSFVFGSSA